MYNTIGKRPQNTRRTSSQSSGALVCFPDCREGRPDVADPGYDRGRFLGAGLYELNPDRRGYVNGYKSKTLDTTAGTVTVHVPKAAGIDEPFYPQSLEREWRSSRAVMLAIAELKQEGAIPSELKHRQASTATTASNAITAN